MFQTSWVHSQDGLKHVEEVKNCKMRNAFHWFMLHNYIKMHDAKNTSQNILLIVQLTGTLCYVYKH